jgi:hypothetical protein
VFGVRAESINKGSSSSSKFLEHQRSNVVTARTPFAHGFLTLRDCIAKEGVIIRFTGLRGMVAESTRRMMRSTASLRTATASSCGFSAILPTGLSVTDRLTDSCATLERRMAPGQPYERQCGKNEESVGVFPTCQGEASIGLMSGTSPLLRFMSFHVGPMPVGLQALQHHAMPVQLDTKMQKQKL